MNDGRLSSCWTSGLDRFDDLRDGRIKLESDCASGRLKVVGDRLLISAKTQQTNRRTRHQMADSTVVGPASRKCGSQQEDWVKIFDRISSLSHRPANILSVHSLQLGSIEDDGKTCQQKKNQREQNIHSVRLFLVYLLFFSDTPKLLTASVDGPRLNPP